MKSTAKTKSKSRKNQTSGISFAEAENLLNEALRAELKDLKVPISVRLDGDVYLELKRLAEDGYGDGKYQAYLNQILRHQLFGEALKAAPKSRKKVAG